MIRLIVWNMIYNGAFVLMAASEMLGVTDVHSKLPPQGKWIWISALAAGNLCFHLTMIAKIKGETHR